jgi:hypothetical protein
VPHPSRAFRERATLSEAEGVGILISYVPGLISAAFSSR